MQGIASGRISLPSLFRVTIFTQNMRTWPKWWISFFIENIHGTIIDRENTVNLDELGIISLNLSGLDLPFTEEEVWSTIKKLPSDKAPGPDGLTGRFYKSCWPVIK
jgi:hypothetical protein